MLELLWELYNRKYLAQYSLCSSLKLTLPYLISSSRNISFFQEMLEKFHEFRQTLNDDAREADKSIFIQLLYWNSRHRICLKIKKIGVDGRCFPMYFTTFFKIGITPLGSYFYPYPIKVHIWKLFILFKLKVGYKSLDLKLFTVVLGFTAYFLTIIFYLKQVKMIENQIRSKSVQVLEVHISWQNYGTCLCCT